MGRHRMQGFYWRGGTHGLGAAGRRGRRGSACRYPPPAQQGALRRSAGGVMLPSQLTHSPSRPPPACAALGPLSAPPGTPPSPPVRSRAAAGRWPARPPGGTAPAAGRAGCRSGSRPLHGEWGRGGEGRKVSWRAGVVRLGSGRHASLLSCPLNNRPERPAPPGMQEGTALASGARPSPAAMSASRHSAATWPCTISTARFSGTPRSCARPQMNLQWHGTGAAVVQPGQVKAVGGGIAGRRCEASAGRH